MILTTLKKHFIILLIIFLNALSLPSYAETVAVKFIPNVSRGYLIDVWRLREDVKYVESFTASDNIDECTLEGDPDTPVPSLKQQKLNLNTEENCIREIHTAYEKYQKIFKQFNDAYLPVMYEAIRQGDKVAEVIMRQCDTTTALDRSDIESTCDEDSNKRKIAFSRLKAIGFAPAYKDPGATGKRVHGRRAFTFKRSNSRAWNTDSFAYLRLNREPQTPGFLTWGTELYFAGSKDFYTGLENFDAPWNGAYIEAEDKEIDRYLNQDPRWAVFLLHRIGYHEWVPEGMKSATHILDSSWEGRYELKKRADNWILPMKPEKGQAIIERDGEFMKITIESEINRHPLKRVKQCSLRYSGGLTYYPELTPSGQSPLNTMLGYFYRAGANRSARSAFPKAGAFHKDGDNKEAVAPFHPKKRYKQVLMQCKNAESDRSGSLRFLLLANDILVEFGGSAGKLAVRHYARVKN